MIVFGSFSFGSDVEAPRLFNDADVLVLGASASTSRGLAADDVLVGGELEVNGKLYMDAAAQIAAEQTFEFGTTLDVRGTVDNAVFVAPKAMVLGALAARNYDHGTPANPTFYVHSATDPNTDNTQWIGAWHDQTSARVASGSGAINIGTAAATGHALGTGDVLVGGALEVDGVVYADAGVVGVVGDSLASGAEIAGRIIEADGVGGTRWATASGGGLAYSSGTTDPTTTEFPTDQDRGIHENTTAGRTWLAINDNGTIREVLLTDVTISGAGGVAMGDGSDAFANAVAYGTSADAGSDDSVAIGSSAAVAASLLNGPVAIGVNAIAEEDGSIAIGHDAAVNAAFSGGHSGAVIIGDRARIDATSGGVNGAVAIGTQARIWSNATYGIAIGQGTNINSGDAQGIAIGWGAGTSGANAVTIGALTLANARSVCVGDSASATGVDSVSIGEGADADFSRSTAVGAEALARQDGVVVGEGSSCGANEQVIIGGTAVGGAHVGAMAFGFNSVTTAADRATFGDPNTADRKEVEVTDSLLVHGADTLGSQHTLITANEELLTGLTGASVTATGIIPAGAVLLGVTARVTTAITGATSFDIGDGTDVDRWGGAIAIGLGTTADITDWTADTAAPVFSTAQNIVLTANGSNFTAGAVRLTAHYLQAIPPTA